MAEPQIEDCPPIPCLIADCICELLDQHFPGLKANDTCTKNGVQIKAVLDDWTATNVKTPVGGCEMEIGNTGNVFVEFYLQNYCDPQDSCPTRIMQLAATAMRALLSSNTLRKKFRIRYVGASNSVNRKDKTAFHQERFTVHWIEKVPLDNGI